MSNTVTLLCPTGAAAGSAFGSKYPHSMQGSVAGPGDGSLGLASVFPITPDHTHLPLHLSPLVS